MEESTAREKIFKKIRNALIEKSEVPYPILDQESDVYHEITESPDIIFAQEFVHAGGKFVYCESEDEFIGILKSFILEKNWPLLFCGDPLLQNILNHNGIPFESDVQHFEANGIGITRCESLIARLGSIMVSSRLNPGRKLIMSPDIHLIVATSSQLVPDLKQAYQGIRKKYSENYPSFVSVITGPSRTMCVENMPIIGAHGPKELYLFFIEDAVERTS